MNATRIYINKSTNQICYFRKTTYTMKERDAWIAVIDREGGGVFFNNKFNEQ